MDWQQYIYAFGIGAFPWISQLKKLDVHFEIENLQIKSIFNFFASIFSFSIFFYLTEIPPYEIMFLPNWWIFIIISFFLSTIYFTIFIYFREKVNKKIKKYPIIVNFLCYILIFCTLTSGFGLLSIHKDYYLISGAISNSYPNNNQETYKIEIYDLNNEPMDAVISNKKGIYKLLITKNDFKNCNRFVIYSNSTGQLLHRDTFLGPSSIITQLKKIKIKNNSHD